ncbi:hypothetical protein RFM23_30710 [Mesorhizobium abyssinicae]|uniref:Uncharacterized protein n=1 Tax=Mesorhizobium abyssinicae TaxID=1209958 RepID=A0ABU5AXC9_9HYPH|nr:hypothetical protein [Mesorhizobium abyssinicae]MDX8541975.1 hypothetical protein [Mesorhizobium abyssinicae]
MASNQIDRKVERGKLAGAGRILPILDEERVADSRPMEISEKAASLDQWMVQRVSPKRPVCASSQGAVPRPDIEMPRRATFLRKAFN